MRKPSISRLTVGPKGSPPRRSGPRATTEDPRESGSGSRQALEALAAKRGISVPQAALAWLLARSPVMLPLPGTSKRAHLEENVAAGAIRFTPEEMRAIG